MTGHEKGNITVDKREEMRSREISNMINEGGLGADEYYIIQKKMNASEQRDSRMKENR